MSLTDLEITWRKSARSANGPSNCVEVAVLGDDVLVRDSKDRAGPVLRIDRADWHELVGGVKRGELQPN